MTRRDVHELWRLRKDGDVTTCELSSDDSVGFVWHLRLVQNGEVLISRRCVTLEEARFVAESLRQDYAGTGWML